MILRGDLGHGLGWGELALWGDLTMAGGTLDPSACHVLFSKLIDGRLTVVRQTSKNFDAVMRPARHVNHFDFEEFDWARVISSTCDRCVGVTVISISAPYSTKNSKSAFTKAGSYSVDKPGFLAFCWKKIP